jgi:hypothetical protein
MRTGSEAKQLPAEAEQAPSAEPSASSDSAAAEEGRGPSDANAEVAETSSSDADVVAATVLDRVAYVAAEEATSVPVEQIVPEIVEAQASTPEQNLESSAEESSEPPVHSALAGAEVSAPEDPARESTEQAPEPVEAPSPSVDDEPAEKA